MFTGIVTAVATVEGLNERESGAILSIARPESYRDVRAGESISVSGACLTVLPPLDGTLRFDVSPETLSRSTLGRLARGRRVNLERALAAGDRFGGHVVAGHVDATTPIRSVSGRGGFWTLAFALGADWSRYVVEKGSIALDGVSLTVARLREADFEVAFVPHTLEATTLGATEPGAVVNVEVDVLGKYVERILGVASGASLDDRLRRLLTT